MNFRSRSLQQEDVCGVCSGWNGLSEFAIIVIAQRSMTVPVEGFKFVLNLLETFYAYPISGLHVFTPLMI